MKLDANSIAYIQNVSRTAQMVGIDNVIIEPGIVRGIHDDKTVVLVHNKDVPEMSFGSIGINRISTFLSRIDIVKTREHVAIEATIDEDKGFARSLIMKGEGVKIDYRCANPATIQAPKQINDVLKYAIVLTPEAIMLLQKGQSAMEADSVNIQTDKDGVVFFVLSDINSDEMKFKIADSAEKLDKDTKPFSHRYPLKVLLTLFKHDPSATFSIGGKGILQIMINGLNIYVLPQA
jgi:hypothetical protein